MPSNINPRVLFVIGNLALFMIGLGFAVRANIAADIQTELFNPIDLAQSASMVGEVLGATFTGFALTLLFGSALLDHIGMKVMLLFAAFGFFAGSMAILLVSVMPPTESTYWVILISFLLTGLGWGAVEAATNPMVATLFPEDKTHRLNILHAWWPAGIVVGGLAGLAVSEVGLPWQVNLVLLMVPAIVLAWLVLISVFPVTERVAAGISHRDMYLEILRSPGFWIWFVCMMLTATSELAPGQWVDLALSNVVGMQGIILLIYVSSLMFVMRHFAGPIAQRFSPAGLLWFSSLFAAIGLYLLSIATTPVWAFCAATVWGIGVCYMYPTMLASVSERYPRGGAFLMGLMGFAAGMAIQFVLPRMGAIFDAAKIEAAGGVEALAGLSGNELAEVLRYASVESFQAVTIVPLLLLPIFGFIWWRDGRSAATDPSE
ncbi:MAG: MFS transporter [Pseudomonadales bacterium]|jgi:predicted MFS family arabinose efflux permease|nr:MFS transporter [Pseudomonadales bacterium]MDP7596681.1 MFS transporter [Pseudomonadales bacterium]HJN50946.1 MFS transporter [Pseudomonadales bacterium]|tara:strand:+ start:4034 stop:5329 length:1296 start_codon:yes stop_codon:yes gene_type:complete